jgi:hypothetical protein
MLDTTRFKKVYYSREDRFPYLAGGLNDMTDGQHERTYMVQCWVHPSSGKDVVEKNRTMDEFKFFLSHVFNDDSALKEGLTAFEKEVDGFVLRPFFFKVFENVSDPESEFMPKVHLQNPEARFASCQEVPNSK